MEYKVDRETAIGEFEKFCDANAIDYDEANMSEELEQAFGLLKGRFVKACMEGRVVVDGRNLEYTVSNFSDSKGDKVTVKAPKGHAFMVMDGYDQNQSVHKMQSFFSAMTGKESKYFSKLDRLDWLFFMGLATLFLAE